jgi:hypothetical protein
LLRRRRRLFSRSALLFLPVGIADHLFDGPNDIGPFFLEVLKVKLLDKLG